MIFHGNEVLRNRHISMMWRDGLEFLIERGGFDIESRHLLGPPRVRGAAQSVVKKPLYGLMRMLLSGDLEGETRLYALKPGDRMTTKAGPGEVY